MKRTILLGFLIFSLITNAQDFYSSGDCKASFKFEVNPNIYTLLPATAINFYDTSEGNVKAWYWDCGDSITSTEQNPLFIFNHPIGGPTVKISPYRTVRLTIVTDSCKSTFSQLINIIDGTLYEQQSCNARYKYYESGRDSIGGTAKIVFNNYSEGNDLKYFWQFGDGETSSEKEPVHKFNLNQPEYKVCLTVTGSDSCTSVFCDVVSLINPDIQPLNCLALFKHYEYGRDTVGGTAKIVFNNYSEGTDLQYFWQFGDMETSTEKEPVHKFNLSQPEYKVCLTVTGPDGCTSIDCKPVYLEYPAVIDTVLPGCFVDFGFERQDLLMSPLPSVVMKFYYKSFPEATEWYWDFGDGTTSNEPYPTHAYIKPFTNDSMKVMYNPFRTICLTIKTADECKISSCQTVQVFDYFPEPERCKAYFKYFQPDDIVSIPEVVPIRLVDVTEGDVISRLWRFEDGTISTEKEPLVSFNIFQPEHKVCLEVTFADSCVSTFCDAVYLYKHVIDTIPASPDCPYYIKVDGGFPIEMSSCAGWASASVYLNDSLVEPQIISWSTGEMSSKVDGLCPTQTYTVKALMPDGCAVWTNFILSADGSITPVSPVNWWLSGEREKLYVRSDAAPGMKVEWRLCDGTIVEADSIPLDAINCGGDVSNMIIKDSEGNVLYSELIALKGTTTGIDDRNFESIIKIWPNPVSDKLNIRYLGKYQNELNAEVLDIMGKQVSKEIFHHISDGYEFSINTEALNPGIYILRLSSEGKIFLNQKITR